MTMSVMVCSFRLNMGKISVPLKQREDCSYKYLNVIRLVVDE